MLFFVYINNQRLESWNSAHLFYRVKRQLYSGFNQVTLSCSDGNGSWETLTSSQYILTDTLVHDESIPAWWLYRDLVALTRQSDTAHTFSLQFKAFFSVYVMLLADCDDCS